LNKFVKSAAKLAFKALAVLESPFDSTFFLQDIPKPDLTHHERTQKTLAEIGNHEGMRVLEIGSREVTGVAKARQRFDKAEYVGFDFYPGRNVDVVGDVHQLSVYFHPPAIDSI
jgi:hypothetical protein